MALNLPVDDVAAQHRRIIAALRLGECTNTEFQRTHDVPSSTKRISELRAMGWPITRRKATMPNADGTRLRIGVTVYRLDGTHPQGDLFGLGGAL